MTDQEKSYRPDVARIVEPLRELAGSPKSDPGRKGYIDAICRIIQDQPHVDKTALQTAEWLIEEALLRFDRFPSAAELHELYRTLYRPADQGPITQRDIEWVKSRKKEKQ